MPRRLLALAAGLCAGAIGMMAVGLVTATRRPVQVILSSAQYESHAIEGGLIEMHYHLVRRSDCNSASTTWMWRWMDGTHRTKYIVKLDANQVTLADVSPLLQDFILAQELPRAVTAGQWYLKIKLLDYCGVFPILFGPTVRIVDDLPIAVSSR